MRPHEFLQREFLNHRMGVLIHELNYFPPSTLPPDRHPRLTIRLHVLSLFPLLDWDRLPDLLRVLQQNKLSSVLHDATYCTEFCNFFSVTEM